MGIELVLIGSNEFGIINAMPIKYAGPITEEDRMERQSRTCFGQVRCSLMDSVLDDRGVEKCGEREAREGGHKMITLCD